MTMDIMLLLIVTVVGLSVTGASAQCPSGWTFWEGSCYSFMSQYRLNWNDAEEKCQEADANSHLVSIGSPEENQWIYNWWVSMIEPLSGQRWKYVWVGYTDQTEEGKWVWSDGAQTGFTTWGGRQPNNAGGISHCALMVTRGSRDPGKWDDGKCSARRGYVCEYRVTQ